MKATCSTCRHWSQRHFGTRGNPRFRSCEHPKLVSTYQSAESLPDDAMITEADEGWGFETGPDFGCIHHEFKKDPAASHDCGAHNPL